MIERVRAVVADVFRLDVETVPNDASAETSEGWDSLRHLELMLALEHEFGLRVPTGRMLELTSIDRIVEFLEER